MLRCKMLMQLAKTHYLTWCRKLILSKAFSISAPCCVRMNEINIQMLSESLYNQIFKTLPAQSNKSLSRKNGNEFETLKARMQKIEKHLVEHNLWGRDPVLISDVDLELPKLLGNNLDEHMQEIAAMQISDYVRLAELLISTTLPNKPLEWRFEKGWTKYLPDGSAVPVEFPEEDVLVFDVEVLMNEGHYPTLATTVSDKYWYSWCSDYLIADKFCWTQDIHLSDLIPMEGVSSRTKEGELQKRLVIGHNVGFDRSFLKEQYYTRRTNMRFLDTMSLHIAVCGLTSFQRILYQASKTHSNRKEVREYTEKQFQFNHTPGEDWKEVSGMNNLSDVYQLHTGREPISKEERKVFIEGTMKDVREQFQQLMNYCSGDVEATLETFRSLWPEFNDRFPHPVTLAGMLELGMGYLPINRNWERYIEQANATYEDLQRESKLLLMGLANDACQLLESTEYKNDPWLWDLDWTVKPVKLKKITKKKTKDKPALEEETAEDRVKRVLESQERIPKNMGHKPGYPDWYRELCPKENSEEWKRGPSLISSQVRVAPKLLRLTWDGFPVHYSEKYGWGYLVPGRTDNLLSPELQENLDNEKQQRFPTEALYKLMGVPLEKDEYGGMTARQYEDFVNSKINSDGMDPDESSRHWKATGMKVKPQLKFTKKEQELDHIGDGPYTDEDIPGCWFFKIPHKDGKGKRVGNPLAKNYVNMIENGTLRAMSGDMANLVLRNSNACSYWKMNKKRIESQMTVWFKKKELSKQVLRSMEDAEDGMFGAILPRIISAGTVTRRAVEPTWLTASNAYEDRVGSELKAMIQAPPGYHFVGADVDSQELWIAAIIGDSYFAKIHGCTALGWMTLQGKKSDKTDLHSKVAETVEISRDHAKVFNYGRIYGAGQKFAEKLLLQFNHKMTEKEAKEKAAIMYKTTKGVRKKETGEWDGGSESAMFNKLESIAKSSEPKTPVLSCSISKALEPDNVNDDVCI
ncbi:hypothetical protein CHS0354_037959 [Potamilus streckersoni]|uniref:DNA polymerase subunit gamma-1 n=1 Tax=Potamilus streckersoni TaxID=2493646 RepID=A0AAE0T9C8_9BIVA|nr:hypothetical protein CHS0354_037959 [Potamilus streckersoni]